MTDEMGLRQALPDDIPTLARHHRCMGESIACERRVTLAAAGWDMGESTYACYLRSQMAQSSAIAWVVQSGGRIVASGTISLLPWPPGWGDQTADDARVGLVHSVWTEPDFRRRGCARRIVQAAMDWCRANRLKRLHLGASAAGRPLYEQMGFKPAATMMQLALR